MPMKTMWVACSCELTPTKVRANLRRRTMREVDLSALTGLKTDNDDGLDLALHVRGEDDLWLRFEDSVSLNDFISSLRIIIGHSNTYKYVLEIEEMR